MINLFQQRDFGDKINATFQYIGENFRSLSLTMLYIVGPVALIAGIASGIMQSNMLGVMADIGNADRTDPTAPFQIFSQLLTPSFWLAIIFAILANLFVSLATYAHMKLYARSTAQNVVNRPAGPPTIEVAAVWNEVQPMIGRTIVISLLSSIIIGVGFVFLFIPGLYVAVVLSLALAVTAFEGTDFGSTWNRCFQLIRDKWWSTLGLIIVISIIVSIVSLVFSIPSAVIGFMAGTRSLTSESSVWIVLGNVIAIVGRTLLNSILYVAIGFQYTNLVERQEGRGLISAVDSIGTSPAQPRAQDEGEY